MVIFGASGDLAKRKLMPAIYELAREKLLPDKFAVIGFARTDMSDDAFRKDFKESIQKYARSKSLDDDIWKKLEPAIYYVSGEDYGSAQAHKKLAGTFQIVAEGLLDDDAREAVLVRRTIVLPHLAQTRDDRLKGVGRC